MPLNRETVIKALEGASLSRNPILSEDNGRPTAEHRVAVQTVLEDLNAFRQIVQEEVKKFPNTDKFVGHLISERLLQDAPLESPIIQALFPAGPIELENRLSRILHVPNIETVSINVHAPKASDKGDDTDETIKDIWAEFFVADFLVSTLMPNYIEKVVRGESEPAVEFYIQKNSEEWILEVARLRKKEFNGETMTWSSKDCSNPKNVETIQKVLRSKLEDKKKQIRKFLDREERDFDKRIVAIKTSQEEYQDCYKVIVEKAKEIMNEGAYPEITYLLLIYDTETYDFINNTQVS
jgi:hypothetical protein